MRINVSFYVVVWVIAVMIGLQPAFSFAQDNSYKRFFLEDGISIEAPSHWYVHTESEKRNFSAASRAAAKISGQEYDTEEDISRLIAISALPVPSGAKVRVNLVKPLTISSSALRSVSNQELKEIQAQFTEAMARVLPAIGGKLLDVGMPRIETINGSPALLVQYRRGDSSGKSSWIVKQYKIPANDKLIELTLSYRESDAVIWAPIVEYIGQSLKF